MYATKPTSKQVPFEEEAIRKKDFGEILQERYKQLIYVGKNQIKPSSETVSLCRHTIVWRKQEKIAMCPVYKSATASWNHFVDDISFAKKEAKEAAKMILINGRDRKTTIDTLSKYESPSE